MSGGNWAGKNVGEVASFLIDLSSHSVKKYMVCLYLRVIVGFYYCLLSSFCFVFLCLFGEALRARAFSDGGFVSCNAGML